VARPARLSTVVADTGAIYALIDADDAWHARVRDWWALERRDVVLPVTILPEVAYLLHTRIGPAAELAFARAVVHGQFRVEPVEPEDIDRAASVMEQYLDFPLGFVDASVVALAERLHVRDVLTTDRRHFAAIHPRHARSLVLHP
jgi:uncharacterized protein